MIIKIDSKEKSYEIEVDENSMAGIKFPVRSVATQSVLNTHDEFGKEIGEQVPNCLSFPLEDDVLVESGAVLGATFGRRVQVKCGEDESMRYAGIEFLIYKK